ncbi:MazG nucleotide pyrophosphohydrolase domain-containing protein [Roseibium album]|uniref:MazG nucleotide pyrophosphohydrolase domain-containing protein n=1 Tax=Roseibium album TaxID=311410 RepID=UPI00391939BE
MHISDFSTFNRRRCEAKHGFNHPIEDWTLSDWMTATVGEVGEAANIIKKLNRVRDGIPGNRETPEDLRAALAEEFADAFTYLDLMAQAAGIDLEQATIDKFEKVSKRIGYENTMFRRSL